MVRAIVGANWGDEGKGKMTDILAGEADFVVRYQGGSNAGHTIINDYGKFALHLLPSGVFYNHTTNILGPGVALNIQILLEELENLSKKGIGTPKVLISDRAQVVMPWHIMFDKLEEQRLDERNFGSTQSGIAPFYSDKYSKTGIQVSDLYYPAILKGKIRDILEVKNILFEHLYYTASLKVDEIYQEYVVLGDKVKHMVCDTNELLFDALQNNKNILLEGQLGALRDPDLGIYPFSTSSSTLAGYASVGAGIPPHKIESIVAVVKAYSSCVGAGPFVTEIHGSASDELRERGGDAGEYGATTGRPRRMGWFDIVATSYGCKLQGATEVALTLLDVLGYLDEIPVCVGYEIDGELTEKFPVTNLLSIAKPVYTILPCWKCSISGIKKFDSLPQAAQDYVRFIEDAIKIPINWISNGPKREDIITM